MASRTLEFSNIDDFHNDANWVLFGVSGYMRVPRVDDWFDIDERIQRLGKYIWYKADGLSIHECCSLAMQTFFEMGWD